MPFDNKAKLSVEYKDNGTGGEITISGRVYFIEEDIHPYVPFSNHIIKPHV